LQHLLLESRPELTVPDLMFVSVRIPYVSAQLGARYAIPLNAFCAGAGLVRVQSRGTGGSDNVTSQGASRE